MATGEQGRIGRVATSAHNSDKYLFYHREHPKRRTVTSRRNIPEMVWSKLETKLRTFEPPTTDLLFTGPAGLSLPRRTSPVRCTDYLSSVSLSGASNMTSNYGISTYHISKYSRQISQSSVDIRNCRNGGEWEHRSGSGLRVLLERTLIDNGGPDGLVLRVVQGFSSTSNLISRSNILVGCLRTRRYV